MNAEMREHIRKERSRIVLAQAKREMKMMREYFDVGRIDSVVINRDETKHQIWKDKQLLEKKGLARTEDGNLICIECGRISHPHANYNGKGNSPRHLKDCPRLNREAA